MFVSWIKKTLRSNLQLEIVSYLVHNNLLANTLNFSGEGAFDKSVEGLYAHGVEIADRYIKASQGDLRGKTVLEVGCGLSLATAYYLIKEAGVARVYAYDWFDCRHNNDLALVNKYGLCEYVDRALYITGDYRSLEDVIAPGTIDYVYSNAVLEHVSDLESLFMTLDRLLALTGAMYHRVDLRCHNRFRSQGELYFHTFSPLLWQAMGDKVGHPNRWLLRDYKDLFARYGYSTSYAKIQTFPPDVLSDAKRYLKNRALDDYETAVFDVELMRRRT